MFRTRARLALLLVLFFLSGASALVYQVLWMRLLALVFGVTVHAASTVLAAFMLGLAIGSAGAGRLADRVRRPLVTFAAAEALVAAAALAKPSTSASTLRSAAGRSSSAF
jgi:spermidine synthase